jgi:hypothetical protein
VKQWVSLLESIAEQQWDWRVPNDIVRIHCWTTVGLEGA